MYVQAMLTCTLSVLFILSETLVHAFVRNEFAVRGRVVSMSVNGIGEEYVNPFTKVLSGFISSRPISRIKNEQLTSKVKNLDDIKWDVKKRTKISLSALASRLYDSLVDSEWFVTGLVDPSYFSDEFAFQDPDVKIKGIEQYARGVNKIFAKNCRAEIVTLRVNGTVSGTLTVTWRLSGKVNIGPGLEIKPFVVFTDFKVDPKTGLIVFQEDRFANPGRDILLSALFPFLIGKVLKPPAPPVEVLREEFLRAEKESKRRVLGGKPLS